MTAQGQQNNKVLVLGASGYVGSAFVRLLRSQEVPVSTLSRREVNYHDLPSLIAAIKQRSPGFLINAAGYTGKPNVDACEIHKSDCLLGNSALPAIIRQACESTQVPWGHISSGCIYNGARADGTGFRETDPPNFDFRHNNCSFYSGCKALGEEVLAGADNVYLWRMRIPFNHQDSGRNYLSKLLRYPRLLDARNSISNLDDFVRVCWACWQRRVPYGIYNVTNPGSITTREAVAMLEQILQPNRSFDFFNDEADFMAQAAKTPRSNCVLDTSKIEATGIPLIPVGESIERSLRAWTNAT